MVPSSSLVIVGHRHQDLEYDNDDVSRCVTMCDVSLFRVSNAVTVSRFQMHHVVLFSDWHLRIIITNHPGWIEPQADRLHFHFHIISHYFSTSSRRLPRKKWAKLRRQLVTFVTSCDFEGLLRLLCQAPAVGWTPEPKAAESAKSQGNGIQWNSCLKMFKGHNFILSIFFGGIRHKGLTSS